MNKLASAIQELQKNDGNYTADNLTMYKKASASVALNENYPRIADQIVNAFYKQAQADTAVEIIENTARFGRAMTKIAGTNFDDKAET